MVLHCWAGFTTRRPRCLGGELCPVPRSANPDLLGPVFRSALTEKSWLSSATFFSAIPTGIVEDLMPHRQPWSARFAATAPDGRLAISTSLALLDRPRSAAHTGSARRVGDVVAVLKSPSPCAGSWRFPLQRHRRIIWRCRRDRLASARFYFCRVPVDGRELSSLLAVLCAQSTIGAGYIGLLRTVGRCDLAGNGSSFKR